MRGFCRITLLAACVVALSSTAVAAAATPMTVERTEVHQVESKHLGGSQEVLVGLPPGYDKAKDTSYPVAVVLGGESAFLAAKVAAEAIVEPQGFSGLVLLGLSADLTPSSLDYETASVSRETSAEKEPQPTGAARLRGFLGEELLPWAAASYRLTAQRLLIGHSFEAFVATHTLLTSPKLFGGYIISSPTLEQAEGAIFEYEKVIARTLRDVPAKVFFSVGARERQDPNLVGEVTRMVSKIRTRGYRDIETLLRIIDSEGHATAMLPAFSQGLQFVLIPKN